MPRSSPLAHVRVVLVRTRRQANVGAAARAMANMGLRELILVQPAFDKRAPVRWIAHGAEDLVDGMQTVNSLAEALEGTSTAVATTARRRRWRSWPLLDPPLAGAQLATATAEAPAALVFGPEDKGLSNDDLALCTHLARIDADPGQPSLNLAQAVLLFGYEARCHARGPRPRRTRIPADAGQVDGTLEQLAAVLERVGFFRGRNRTQVLATARQILTRTSLTREEIGFLRGSLRKLGWGLDHPEQIPRLGETDDE
jgi:tRNA/rRNA methyltransferase